MAIYWVKIVDFDNTLFMDQSHFFESLFAFEFYCFIHYKMKIGAFKAKFLEFGSRRFFWSLQKLRSIAAAAAAVPRLISDRS